MLGERRTFCHVPYIVVFLENNCWPKTPYYALLIVCPRRRKPSTRQWNTQFDAEYLANLICSMETLTQCGRYRLIAAGTFGPDEIRVMTAAYEGALTDPRDWSFAIIP